MNGIDPYKILGVSRNFTLEELKESFKKNALRFHPDIKKTGNEEIFKLVVHSYKKLLEIYETQKGDKQYGELKAEFKKTINNTHTDYNFNPIEVNSQFNVNKFNQMFDDNRLEDVNDTGYKDWLENNPDKSEESSIKYNKKFTNKAFNEHFDENVNNKSQNKHLIKYREPEAICSIKKMNFTNLGEDDIDDFSAENKSLKNLNFMDLKLAYTTSRIIDPSTVDPRKEYTSVDQLKKDRSKVRYEMNPDERNYNSQKIHLERIKEQKRLENLLRHDQRISDHFSKINYLLNHGQT